MRYQQFDKHSFNTQPPEGGWLFQEYGSDLYSSFNTQPPEGGWPIGVDVYSTSRKVSTHSRLKAAGDTRCQSLEHITVSTHSRLKAAGYPAGCVTSSVTAVSTHSRLKAAGSITNFFRNFCGCFNTQPPEGGWNLTTTPFSPFFSFNTQPPEGGWGIEGYPKGLQPVSTHSRLKAAGSQMHNLLSQYFRFQHTAA